MGKIFKVCLSIENIQKGFDSVLNKTYTSKPQILLKLAWNSAQIPIHLCYRYIDNWQNLLFPGLSQQNW